ncbi:HAD family hydrolase [Nonomuraea jabiensis]|uniref:HAD family hydrolase n=1 Tax=Nonomuraea jabiensis TaxID=882448 RepID=UPI00368035E8
MIALLAQLRRHVPVGVLSNCTDALRRDLDHHGIQFDYAFPSAELGVDKPSPLAFRAAERMAAPTPELAYSDDEPTFVTAATSAGLQTHLFEGPERFVADLHRLGLPIAMLDTSGSEPNASPRPSFRLS